MFYLKKLIAENNGIIYLRDLTQTNPLNKISKKIKYLSISPDQDGHREEYIAYRF